ncbi:hypothetical protein [Longivirga aurantiaca]|uniref:Calcium-binding protein n=1 Tax=Longivirga aurantiaca TaxID=1837743 RepID=A0ABW1T2W4_9ACTN
MSRASAVVRRTSLLGAAALAVGGLQLPMATPAWGLTAVTGDACTIIGTPGDDVLIGTDGPDVICGRGGRDNVRGGAGDDVIDLVRSDGLAYGGAGNDRLYGGVRAATVYGGDGDDVLVGTGAHATLRGEAGADVLRQRASTGLVLGGPGDDTLYASPAGSFLDGEQGADRLVGSTGADELHGGLFSDEQDGPDLISGGAGNDRLWGRGGDDNLDGGPGDDRLMGDIGDDVLVGGPGADLLLGGYGADVVSGGTGVDTVSYAGRDYPVTITQDAVADDGRAGEGDSVPSDVEVLIGSDAGDLIVGGAGAQRLEGGRGDDVLDGGPGSDTFVGGKGLDEVTYVHRGVAIVASLDGVRNDGAAGELDLIGTDVETVTGGSAADRLSGGSGDDELRGGPGADILIGGPGRDTATYSERTSPVTADLAGDSDDGEPGERDKISTTIEVLVGGSAGDTLVGSGRADVLLGMGGDDRLLGGAGRDRISGAEGTDVVVGGADLDLCDKPDAGEAPSGCELQMDVPVEKAVVITGKLLTRTDGPVAGVTLALTNDQDPTYLSTSVTASDGSYRLVGVPTSLYTATPSFWPLRLTVRRDGVLPGTWAHLPGVFSVRSVPLGVDDATNPPEGSDVVWTLRPEQVSVAVTVLDRLGDPVPGCLVSTASSRVEGDLMPGLLGLGTQTPFLGARTTGTTGTMTMWALPTRELTVNVDCDTPRLTLHSHRTIVAIESRDYVVRP